MLTHLLKRDYLSMKDGRRVGAADPSEGIAGAQPKGVFIGAARVGHHVAQEAYLYR